MISTLLQHFKRFVYGFLEHPFDPALLELPSGPLSLLELERRLKQISELHHDDPELLRDFEAIADGCRWLTGVALKHDYSEHIQANGFHTYCDLILVMSQALLLMHQNGTFVRQHCQHICKLCLAGIQICRELENDENLFTDKVTFVALLNLAQEMREELCCVYTFYNSCWLYPCAGKMIQFFGAYMAVYFGHWHRITFDNSVLDRHRRGELFTSFSLDSNIDCLKSCWNISEYRPMKMYMSRSIGYYYDIDSCDVWSPRQTRWKVSTFEYETVFDMNVDQNVGATADYQKNRVRGMLFRSTKARLKDRNLLIHVHGGGFISQSPETHSYYLCDWVQNLKNVTVLSIDYTLSPEGPFPEALQEVLDVYLWLISGSPEVKESLGFKPKSIAICGDSAGGNIATALTMVLAKIRQKQAQNNPEEFPVPYPCSLLLFYAPLILTTSYISPSRLIVSVDGLIPVAPLLNCMRAYIPDKAFPVDTQRPSPNESLWTKLRNLVVQNCHCEPWFKQTERLEENMALMNKFLSNPFASPLFNKNYDFTANIRLYGFDTTYDPFLDDTIELAKRWQGPKQIFIMPRLPHGFLNLVKVSEKSASTLTKILEFIADAFEPDSD